MHHDGGKLARFRHDAVAHGLLLPQRERIGRSEKEETTMIPATFPGLPVTLFPGLLLPAAGVSVIDVTASVAAIAWALGGLVALVIAIRMSRDPEHPRHSAGAT